MRINFNKIDGFKVYDGTSYIVLLGGEKYDFIYKMIRYLIGGKSIFMFIISDNNHAKIKVDSYDPLPVEKALTFNKIMMIIKPFFHKSNNSYYYKIFLEKYW